jgi:hypothetical protein
MRRSVLTCTVMLACMRQPMTEQAPDPYLRLDSMPSERIDSASATGAALEGAARATGLAVLRTVALPDSAREMRFSASRSTMVWAPTPLLRLIEWPDRILGELYLYWARLSDSTGQEIQPHWLAHRPTDCRPAQRVPGWAGCRIEVHGGVSWRAVADSLRTLGVWDLVPGAREPPGFITDQDLVLAEVLIGDRYHNFRYYDLDRLQGEDVIRIRAAADLVLSLSER